MNAKGLLPALLLAAAGCTVNTNDFAPRSDAECAASGKKACGYKCVGVDDPATGCGQPGCSACPAGVAHTVPACATVNNSSICAFACAAGWADCNGAFTDGCEAPVDADPANCGACFRSCGNAPCTAGQCAAEVLDMSSVGEPRGIVSGPTAIYWVVEGSGGVAYRWDFASPGFAYSQAMRLAFDLDPGNTGAMFRLARDGASGILFASGATAPPASDLALFKIDPTMFATVPVPFFTRPYSSSHAVLGLAPAGSYAFFSTNVDRGVHWATGPTTESAVSTPAPVNGLTATAVGPSVLYGQGGPGGNAISSLSSVDLGVHPYLATPGSWAARIALFPDTASPTHVIWADETTGGVYALSGGVIYTLDPGNGLPAAMDVAADGWGVVWSSATTSSGKVRAWRATDAALLDIPGRGGPVLGVALAPTHVYWTEGGTSPAVLRVPK